MNENYDWTPVIPAPPDAVEQVKMGELPRWNTKWGKPVKRWLYQLATGGAVGWIVRFENSNADGKIDKSLIPLSYGHGSDGRNSWQWKGFPMPRPLYELPELAKRSNAPVVVVEGEKCASVLGEAQADFIATTWPGGANAVLKADFTTLSKRTVYLWPDNDEAGRKAMRVVALQLKKLGCQIFCINSEMNWPEGHDVADLIASGWSGPQVVEYIKMQSSKISADEHNEDSANARKPSQAEVLIRIARKRAELFRDGDTAYGLMTVDVHKEVWPLKSKVFRAWLYQAYFEQEQKAANAEAIGAALNTLNGFARFGSKGVPVVEHEVKLRIAGSRGKIYLDLCDPLWRAVEIDAEGWRVIENPTERDVYFRRSRGMKPLPAPLSGGSLLTLKTFINFATEDDFVLIVAWLIGALHPRGPYPILALNGEHGSAKTSAARYLRQLIDPNISLGRTAPKKEEDLLIAASNSWIVSFDNLSYISQNLSDGLCRLATGGGLGKRELYTDADECILDARRPQILTSIEEVAKSGDLIDRLILSTLNRIDDEKRCTEGELDRDFDAALAKMLGALLDAVSCALCGFEGTKLDRLPRMADFAKWVVAAELACPWEPGVFMRAYSQNRKGANQTTLEASPIYEPLVALDDFEGTATEFLAALTSKLPDGKPTPKGWPASSKAVSGALRRISPALRCIGIEVTFARKDDRNRTRMIRIQHKESDKATDSPSEPSASSEGQENNKQNGESFPNGGGRTADGTGRKPPNHASEETVNNAMEVSANRTYADVVDAKNPIASGSREDNAKLSNRESVDRERF